MDACALVRGSTACILSQITCKSTVIKNLNITNDYSIHGHTSKTDSPVTNPESEHIREIALHLIN